MNQQNLLNYCAMIFGVENPQLSGELTAELLEGQLEAAEGQLLLVTKIKCANLVGNIKCASGTPSTVPSYSSSILEFDGNGIPVDSGVVAFFTRGIDAMQTAEEKVVVTYREFTV